MRKWEREKGLGFRILILFFLEKEDSKKKTSGWETATGTSIFAEKFWTLNAIAPKIAANKASCMITTQKTRKLRNWQKTRNREKSCMNLSDFKVTKNPKNRFLGIQKVDPASQCDAKKISWL